MTSGVITVLTSPAFARFKHETMYLVGGTKQVVDGRDKIVPSLTAIEGGVLLIPSALMSANTSGLTPAGERELIEWVMVLYKVIPITEASKVQDEVGKKYAVVSVRDYGDHYQCDVKES